MVCGEAGSGLDWTLSGDCTSQLRPELSPERDHVDLAAGPNLGSGGAGEVAQNDEIRLQTESCNSSNVMGLIVL